MIRKLLTFRADPLTICRLCRRKLERYERRENVCDRCLRANQTLPYSMFRKG